MSGSGDWAPERTRRIWKWRKMGGRAGPRAGRSALGKPERRGRVDCVSATPAGRAGHEARAAETGRGVRAGLRRCPG